VPPRDGAQVLFVGCQHRRTEAVPPPVGAHKAERDVQSLAGALLCPPHPAESDRLAADLGKEHVPHRIAVFQMGEHPGYLLHGVDVVELVGDVARVEDGDHEGIVGLAAKAAKDQPSDSWRAGYLDNG
jgi:hypothetical protein